MEPFRFLFRRETRSRRDAPDNHRAFVAPMSGTLPPGSRGRLIDEQADTDDAGTPTC
jgi:hypothetical protein